jgi:hypothetical protein
MVGVDRVGQLRVGEGLLCVYGLAHRHRDRRGAGVPEVRDVLEGRWQARQYASSGSTRVAAAVVDELRKSACFATRPLA